jgi:hypothetical protein
MKWDFKENKKMTITANGVKQFTNSITSNIAYFRFFERTVDRNELTGGGTRTRYVLDYMSYLDKLYNYIKENQLEYPKNISADSDFSKLVSSQLKVCRKYLKGNTFLCICCTGNFTLDALIQGVDWSNYKE